MRVPFTPGMFVARRREFASAFAAELVAKFCGPEDIIRVFGQALDAGLEERVYEKLSPMIRRVIRGKFSSLTDSDIELLAEEVSAFIRESNMVTTIVESNIVNMSPSEIECTVHEIAGREFRSMAFFDAGVGFLVGCVQSLVAWVLLS